MIWCDSDSQTKKTWKKNTHNKFFLLRRKHTHARTHAQTCHPCSSNKNEPSEKEERPTYIQHPKSNGQAARNTEVTECQNEKKKDERWKGKRECKRERRSYRQCVFSVFQHSVFNRIFTCLCFSALADRPQHHRPGTLSYRPATTCQLVYGICATEIIRRWAGEHCQAAPVPTLTRHARLCNRGLSQKQEHVRSVYTGIQWQCHGPRSKMCPFSFSSCVLLVDANQTVQFSNPWVLDLVFSEVNKTLGRPCCPWQIRGLLDAENRLQYAWTKDSLMISQSSSHHGSLPFDSDMLKLNLGSDQSVQVWLHIFRSFDPWNSWVCCLEILLCGWQKDLCHNNLKFRSSPAILVPVLTRFVQRRTFVSEDIGPLRIVLHAIFLTCCFTHTEVFWPQVWCQKHANSKTHHLERLLVITMEIQCTEKNQPFLLFAEQCRTVVSTLLNWPILSLVDKSKDTNWLTELEANTHGYRRVEDWSQLGSLWPSPTLDRDCGGIFSFHGGSLEIAHTTHAGDLGRKSSVSFCAFDGPFCTDWYLDNTTPELSPCRPQVESGLRVRQDTSQPRFIEVEPTQLSATTPRDFRPVKEWKLRMGWSVDLQFTQTSKLFFLS